ncbi:MAG: hypothetical protein K6G16_10915 [Lachnospiraceae bacterium]|nr:hypothetical protein [Lachnospiraceae bacterium]
MIICMILATALLILFLYLLLTTGEGVEDLLISSRIEELQEKIRTAELQMILLAEEMQRHHDLENKKKLRQGQRLRKQKEQNEKQLEALQNGKISVLDIIPLAGYRLLQFLKWDATNPAMQKLIRTCMRYQNRQEAVNRAYYVMAALFGYFLFGLFLMFSVLAGAIALSMGSRALIFAVAVIGVFGLLAYLPFNDVTTVVKERQESIERQFPQVISKLTLLTEAGMEVSRAWDLTSKSGRGTLYEEMNRVNIDLNNNVQPAEAYTSFISRCSNNYTSKLATLIMQNMYKGNAEIVAQFKSLNTESWNEYQNSTKREGERVQTKLFVPTLMMFAGILIMLIVPVMSSFGSF